MSRVALRMLFGDPVKYIGLVFGVAFATVLITQQSALFNAVMLHTVSLIDEAQDVAIWVMDRNAKSLKLTIPLRDGDIARVRSVEGVAWAIGYFADAAILRGANGEMETGTIVGLDDATLIGAPRRFKIGRIEDLRAPDAVAIDLTAYQRFWPDEGLRLGRELTINDRRAVVRAISLSDDAFPFPIIMHTRFSLARLYVPKGRNDTTFILAHVRPGEDQTAVADRITARTGLLALTSAQFRAKTMWYYLTRTAIALNFGITIALGVTVGIAVVGLTFNMFVIENLRQYGALKAIGLTNRRLVGMVALQALIVAAIGYAFGVGATTTFFELIADERTILRGVGLPLWIAVDSAIAIAAIIPLAAGWGLRRALIVDPAIVFRA